jgi:uncharacterized membrane protein YebE (DUF533 family)
MIDLNLKAWIHNVINNPLNEDQLAHAIATQDLIDKIEILCQALEAIDSFTNDINIEDLCRKALAKIRGDG